VAVGQTDRQAAEVSGDLDERGAVDRRRVRVVDDDRLAPRERGGDELTLPPLADGRALLTSVCVAANLLR